MKNKWFSVYVLALAVLTVTGILAGDSTASDFLWVGVLVLIAFGAVWGSVHGNR